jgi:hypothetical protein
MDLHIGDIVDIVKKYPKIIELFKTEIKNCKLKDNEQFVSSKKLLKKILKVDEGGKETFKCIIEFLKLFGIR